MVFIGGPRQVGKTTISKNILKQAYPSGRYFNWDYNGESMDEIAEERDAFIATAITG